MVIVPENQSLLGLEGAGIVRRVGNTQAPTKSGSESLSAGGAVLPTGFSVLQTVFILCLIQCHLK